MRAWCTNCRGIFQQNSKAEFSVGQSLNVGSFPCQAGMPCAPNGQMGCKMHKEGTLTFTVHGLSRRADCSGARYPMHAPQPEEYGPAA